MLIKEFEYTNKETGWTLQNTPLARFNLLVGASGVGKTKILHAIGSLYQLVALGTPSRAQSFKIVYEHESQIYSWELDASAKTEHFDIAQGALASSYVITKERLASNTQGTLIERDLGKTLFKGTELPQLNQSDTALRLFNTESTIIHASYPISNLIIDERPHFPTNIFPDASVKFIENIKTIDNLRGITSMPVALKAFTLQEKFPHHFDNIKSTFIDIFPSTRDVSVTRNYITPQQNGQGAYQQIQFRLREHGVPSWIPAEEISSGMLRTLNLLIDLTLAPSNSVFLIDEFENSLGVNCMGPLTDFIQSRASELQFIITSHHPYIINKIPKSHWKVVRRHGSTVRVTPATEIKALQGTSAQDDFTRLLNAPEFEEGMA